MVFLFVALTSAMIVSTTTMLLIMPQQDDDTSSSREGSASLVATLHRHMKQHHFFLQKQQQAFLEAELLARLVDLLQSRWMDYSKQQPHDIRKERNTPNRALTLETAREEENDSSIRMSPVLLEGMRDYFNRYYSEDKEIDDSAASNNNNTNVKNKTTSHYLRRIKPTVLCWIPQSSDSQCDSKKDITYTILAPMDLRRPATSSNNNNIRNETKGEADLDVNDWTTKQLRQMVWHTLQFLFDTQAARVVWLVLGGASSRQAIQVDSQYGTQLLQWDRTRSNPVQLVYAENLSDAIEQVWTMLTASSKLHLQRRPPPHAILWRNVQEHGQQHNIEPTRAQIHHGLQIWRASTSAMVVFQTKKGLFAAKDDNDLSVLPDWNGLIHHVDYLCFLRPSLLQPKDQSPSWLSSLFSTIVRNDTTVAATSTSTSTVHHKMTPWDVVLTVGHISPVPWRFYGPQNAVEAGMESSTNTRLLLSQENSIRLASKVWGGFPVGPTTAELCPMTTKTTLQGGR